MSFLHHTESFRQFSQKELELLEEESKSQGQLIDQAPDSKHGPLFRRQSTMLTSADIESHEWKFDRESFIELFSDFQERQKVNRTISEKFGGIHGIAKALRTSKTKGLPSDELTNDENSTELREECANIRIDKYGNNKLTRKEGKSFWLLCYEELNDFMLRILIICSIISIIIGVTMELEEKGWIDGLAILIAVLIVVFISASNNYRKEKQFRIMEKESEKKYTIVLRNGIEKELLFENVLIGDLIVLRAGYQVPCDGVFVLGTENFQTDESTLTGETKEIKKNSENQLLMAGTSVKTGDGMMIACALGDASQWGQLMAGLQDERDDTPLQNRLDKLGKQLGYGGMFVGAFLFVILMVTWAIRDADDFTWSDFAETLIDSAIAGVIIIVVAVPEGLPLAVTISLAYSMKTMLTDNNFVRHLSACETMGNATTICSDKTGTLTQNKMSVDKVYFGNGQWYDVAAKQQNKESQLNSDGNNDENDDKKEVIDEIDDNVKHLIIYSQIINSKAFFDKDEQDLGKDTVNKSGQSSKNVSIDMKDEETIKTPLTSPTQGKKNKDKNNKNNNNENEKDSKKHSGKKKLIGGNQTECALLQWAIDLGESKNIDYKKVRQNNPKSKYYPFDSAVKRSSVLCRNRFDDNANINEENDSADVENNSNTYIMYTKGAAEQVLLLCDKLIINDVNNAGSNHNNNQNQEDGKDNEDSDRKNHHNVETEEMTEDKKKDIENAMDAMTRMGLRCLGLCYKEYDESESQDIQENYITDDNKSQGKGKGKGSGGNHLEDIKEDSELEKNKNKNKNKKKKKQNDDKKTGLDDELFESMTWLGLVGIKDPVRPEVPGAVLACQSAGIIVRMVTGDHLETAKHIAKECNILSSRDHVCMEGGEFRQLSESEKEEKLPKLRVLARSKPQDKETLVEWYMSHGHIVAVTGDGANDSLALKKADIGLSMGIQGTDVAKEASDIVIMDDNFKSIEKTVMWGRSVYDNIKKFMQFQLTVNISALLLNVIAAFWEEYQNPLNAVQLLWVNLIMDTLAALALATEKPTEQLLERKPFDKNKSLVSPVMLRFMFGHGLFQLLLLLITLFLGKDILNIKDITDGNNKNIDSVTGQNRELLTTVFNLFVWFQIFNEINARRVNNEWNVLSNFFSNYYFIGIMIITIIGQFLMVTFGGSFLRTVSLNVNEWIYCIAIASSSLIWNQLLRFIPVDVNYGLREIDTDIVFKKDKNFMNGSGGSGSGGGNSGRHKHRRSDGKDSRKSQTRQSKRWTISAASDDEE